MRTRVVSDASFVVPNHKPHDPHAVCRATLFGERKDLGTDRRWFELIGRFPCGHGVMIDVKIYPWCLREALDGRDVSQHWDLRIETVNLRLRRWLEETRRSVEIYSKIGGRIVCDEVEEEIRQLRITCQGWQIPRREQLLRPVRELVLFSRPLAIWNSELSYLTNGQGNVPAPGAPSSC